MNTRMRTLLAVAAAAVIPITAHAQPRDPDWARERHEERREGRQDVRAARDDWRDLKRVEALLADYDRAARDRNARALADLEDQALAILRSEWLEARGELAQDRREAHEDRRDLEHERREGDRGGAMEQHRELREDRRDAAVDTRRMERVRRIGDQLTALRGRFRRGEVARKRDLIAEMVQMARAELARDREKLRDDRRERHEEHHDMR